MSRRSLLTPERRTRTFDGDMKRTSIFVHDPTWKKFQEVVEAKGLSGSNALRQLMRKVIAEANRGI